MSPSVGEVSVITVSDKQITSSCCQKCNWYRAPKFEQVLLASTPLGASYTLLRNFWNVIFSGNDVFCTGNNFPNPKLQNAEA